MDKNGRILVGFPDGVAEIVRQHGELQRMTTGQGIRALMRAGWPVLYPGVPCPIPDTPRLIGCEMADVDVAITVERMRRVRGAA